MSSKRLVRWFPRQAPALDDVKEDGNRMVFCAEKVYPPIRKFLTAKLMDFVQWYYQIAIPTRHLYEVILVDTPCRLYFDIEYSRVLNPDLTERTVMGILKRLIVRSVAVFCQEDIGMQNMIDLQATTETKMSHHLIVHIPGRFFMNNSAVGDFVRRMLCCVESFVDSDSSSDILPYEPLPKCQLRQLFPIAETATFVRSVFVCDMSVYKRNQQFRLFDSCKRGKDNFLIPAEDNAFPLPDNPYNRLENTLVRCSAEGHPILGGTNQTLTAPGIQGPSTSRKRPSSTTPCTSPSSEIASFVARFAKVYDPNAVIHNEQSTSDGKVVKYHVRGKQWCGNIGRPHKSNRIYYVVNYHDNTLYQRCYDIDCGEYKSEAVPLPDNLVPE